MGKTDVVGGCECLGVHSRVAGPHRKCVCVCDSTAIIGVENYRVDKFVQGVGFISRAGRVAGDLGRGACVDEREKSARGGRGFGSSPWKWCICSF